MMTLEAEFTIIPENSFNLAEVIVSLIESAFAKKHPLKKRFSRMVENNFVFIIAVCLKK